MVLPSRAFALAVLAALLLPAAAAQPDPPAPPSTPEQFQCQAPVETCLPDLVPTNPKMTIRDERFPGTACTDFINLGDAPSAQPFRVLLTIDGTAVAEQQVEGVYQRGEGGRDICWGNLTLVAGPHSLEVLVDSNGEVVETNDTNNLRGFRFNVAPTPRFDLRLSSLRVTPEEGGVGVNQIFIVNVTNVGNAGAPLSRLALQDDHGEMANWTVPTLAPGQGWTMAHVTRPELRPVGTFVARAVIDPSDELLEIREDNNEALAEYTVLDHPAPDFSITNVTVSGNRTELRGVRIDVTVSNLGDRAIRGALVHLINETNDTWATGRSFARLEPDGGLTRLQFFFALKAGVHHLRLIVDPTGATAERNESNNVRELVLEIEEPTTVIELPNLIIERIYAMPEDPRPGEMVSVGALIHNVGTNRSAATTVNFLVDDRLVGSATVPVLKPGTYYSAYAPWVPNTSASYSIVAVVDHDERLVELDDDDNALIMDFLVTTQRPPSETPPTPTAAPPVEPTPPTPTTPATPTPATPTLPRDTASRVTVGELIVATKPKPGGASGAISISLRNPNLERVGLLTVQFKVEDKVLKEVLVQGIPGAGTVAATSGEVDLPAGRHTVSAEVRIVGSTGPAVARQGTYDQVAGETEGVPGFGALALLGAVALAVALRRRGS